jgi:hypothetical protein
MAIYCAVHIRDEYLNQMITTCLILVLFMYWVLQCCKGRAKRVAVRKELLTLKYYHTRHQRHEGEDDDIDDDDDDENEEDDEKVYKRLGQTSCDLQCAHAMLGCYATDINRQNMALVESTRRDQDNLCSCLWQSLYGIFGCAYCCGCSLQWCGICATAQEGRDLVHVASHTTTTTTTPHSFIPWHVTFVDYITFQPMLEYYPRIYRLRHESSNNSWLCYHLCCSLSKLSKWILSWALLFFAVLLLWSLLPFVLKQHHAFHWPNYLVLLATFGYGVFVLYWIHAMWHMLDISVDAIIKYYMSGFCLATSMAMVGEVCLSVLIRLATDIMLAMSGIDIVPDSGYGGGGFGSYWSGSSSSTTSYATTRTHNDGRSRHPFYRLSSQWWWGHQANHNNNGMVGNLFTNVLFSATSSSNNAQQQSKQPTHHDYLIAFGYAHPFFYTIYVALNAFIVAALVEEICKYLGYRMVTHPDWSSRNDLEQVQRDLKMQEQLTERHRRQHRSVRNNDEDEDEESEDDEEEDDDDNPDDDEESRSTPRRRSKNDKDASRRKKKIVYSNKNRRRRRADRNDDDSDQQPRAPQLPPAVERGTVFAWKHAHNNAISSTEDDSMDFALQDRTYTSRGAAITVAMIAVAVGFSCCENLVYVFLYAGAGASASASVQWAVLMARALFPVHVISAALQSIGVVQRDIEQRHLQQQQGGAGNNNDSGDKKKIRLGRILWPAILFHGSYDFFIIWIEFLANRRRTLINSGNNQGGGDGSNGGGSGSSMDASGGEARASLVVSVVLEIMALIYYVWASHAQRKRLRAMDGVRATLPTTMPESSVDPSSLL